MDEEKEKDTTHVVCVFAPMLWCRVAVSERAAAAASRDAREKKGEDKIRESL